MNLSEIVRGSFQSAYLGYFAFEPFAGRGLMQLGASQVITHAFDKMKLHRLEANIQPDNAQSKKLVKALGFRREGFSPMLRQSPNSRHSSVIPRANRHSRDATALIRESTRRTRRNLGSCCWRVVAGDRSGPHAGRRAEEWALTRGIDVMGVRSNSLRVQARAFYEHLGYEITKTQNAFRKSSE